MKTQEQHQLLEHCPRTPEGLAKHYDTSGWRKKDFARMLSAREALRKAATDDERQEALRLIARAWNKAQRYRQTQRDAVNAASQDLTEQAPKPEATARATNECP